MGTSNQASAADVSFADTLPGDLTAAIGSAGAVGSAAIKACWVAARIYGGWYEPRTVLVREWLTTEFTNSAFGRFIVRLYIKHVERASKNQTIVALLKPLFDLALRKARRMRG